MADIKTCFRLPIIHLYFAGTFGFTTNSLYCFAVAVVFGSNISASNWEPCCRAIKGLTKKYVNGPDLVQRHKYYIHMVKREVPSPDASPLVKAAKCQMNPGVLDSFGNPIHNPSIIWVCDTLVVAVEIFAMNMTLAAVIKAIFVVMDKSNTRLW